MERPESVRICPHGGKRQVKAVIAWEQRKFGDDLISIQTGTNKLGSENGKGTPLLKMGNIQRGYFSLDKIEYLSDADDVEPENIAYYGDFFFNTRNTLELVGKGATWTGNSGEYAFNSNIARFKLREIDTIFFNYLYNTGSMIEQVHARAMGTTSVAAIYPQSLKSIEYYVPTMAEQQRIGELLLKIDNLITLHQRKVFYRNSETTALGLLTRRHERHEEALWHFRVKPILNRLSLPC